jgi:hypothetical protein
VIITPAINNAVSALAFPAEFRSLPVANGYQAAHQRYTEFKNKLSAQAYALGPGAEVVIVNFRMKTLLPGRKTAVLVSVCTKCTKLDTCY